jgi:hypothetical protein
MPSDNEKQRERLIYGVWYGSDSEIRRVWYGDDSEIRRGTMVLRRESPGPCGWGQRYDFQEDGTLIDAYSADCGNDYSIHTWSGKWELDRERNLLLMKIEKVVFAGCMTSWPCNPPENYKRGRNFFITELTEQRMVLRAGNEELGDSSKNVER